jgi:hypothetical protein
MFDKLLAIAYQFIKLAAVGAVVLLAMIMFDDGSPIDEENDEPRPGFFSSWSSEPAGKKVQAKAESAPKPKPKPTLKPNDKDQ